MRKIEAKNGKIKLADKEKLIWVSIGFALLAWILDSLLDSVIFHEVTVIDQIFNPSNHEIGIRLLFGSIFIVFGIYMQYGITRFKKAEDALKVAVITAEDEKNKTKAIIEAIGDGIILQDTDFKIIYQNQIQNEIYGNRIGEYCYKMYEGKDTICEDCPIEASFIDGKIHKAQRSVPTDKGILYIELTGSPLRDSTGKIIGGVKVVRDITGLKRTEETLRESEEKYRTLFEATPIGIGIADLKGNILDNNQSMQEMSGFTQNELKSIGVSATYVDPDERKLLLKTLQETGRVRDWEVRLKRKNGTIYYALLNADLLELSGHNKVLLTTARDITGRKQAENEKNRFLKAFAGSTDGITIADEKDRFIYVNEAYAMIFGYTKEELIGKTWRKITPPEMIAPTEKGLSNTMHKRDIGTFFREVPGLRKDGTMIPTEVRGRGIWDEKGNYQGHICVVRDVTERKRMEEKLRIAYDKLETRVRERTAELEEVNKALRVEITERKRAEEALQVSEEKYRTMIEHSNDMIWMLDKQANFMYFNKMAEDISGYKLSELKGKSFAPVLSPEDLPRIKKIFIETLSGKSQHYDINVYRNDSSSFILSVNTAPLIESGEIVGTVSFGRDITERKRAEEKTLEQAALLDKAQDAIYVRDLEHRIVYCNKSAERLYGWTVEEIMGKNANELLYNKASPQLIGAKKSVIEKGEWTGDLHQVSKDGKEIIVESRWTLMRDSEGKPRSILVINTDITEKKKFEDKLLRAQRMESIGTLASGVAHDINNVLAPIMLSLELLKEKFTDVESQNLVNILERSAKRGASLIKQVQLFARGVDGERITLQAGHLISEVRQITRETFPRSIETKINIPQGLWTISGDATQMHQVLMNLCLNARDAMPDGGILGICAENLFIDENFTRINIEALVGPYIVITVSDTGSGISPEIMGKIFEPFFTTKESGKGTGLGLSTSLGIVKSHGGFINVYSEVGNGTAFKVYLPAIAINETHIAEDKQNKLPTGHGELILVVDDEGQVQGITKMTLEKFGYKVITANNGAEAIELYKNNSNIKVILMDMMMPVMGGPESIRELRKDNPEVKIIGVSGLTDRNKYEEIAEKQVNAFLTKPYTTEKILNTIHEVISTK